MIVVETDIKDGIFVHKDNVPLFESEIARANKEWGTIKILKKTHSGNGYFFMICGDWEIVKTFSSQTNRTKYATPKGTGGNGGNGNGNAFSNLWEWIKTDKKMQMMIGGAGVLMVTVMVMPKKTKKRRR